MTSACVKLEVYQPPMSLRTADTFVSIVFDASSQPPMASSKAAAPANARGVVATCDVSRMPRFSLQAAAAAAAKTVELMVGCCGLAADLRLGDGLPSFGARTSTSRC